MSVFIELKISPIPRLEKKVILFVISQWNHAGLYQSDAESWLIYFKKNSFQEEEIIQYLNEKNLNYQWKEQPFKLDPNLVYNGLYQPVLVDDYCFIRTPIHPRDSNNCKHEITIIPTLTFGMGDHITTKLMLRIIEKYDFKDKVVLDIGTGTGILAIVALKEGARKAIGIDTDTLAVKNAAYNAKQNELDLTTLKGPIQKLKESVGAHYILANIATPIHLKSVKDYHFHLKPGGVLILSGILDTDEKRVNKAFQSHRFEPLEAIEEAGWMVMSFVKSA